MNVDLDLSKSTKLMKAFNLLHKWHKNGNVGANVWFRVEHTVSSKNFDLRSQKWIQLIVKAIKNIFKESKFVASDTNNQLEFYPFKYHSWEIQQNVSLTDRVAIKLCVENQTIFSGVMVMTLCVSIHSIKS